jgi:hypothetical protein
MFNKMLEGRFVEGKVVMEVLFATVMVEVLVLPAASVAFALKEWLPSATFVVFHEKLYGAAVKVETTVPSTLRATDFTPTLSEAVTLTLTVPDTVDPLAGDVIDTVGTVTSALTTFCDTEILLVALLPAASLAVATIVCVPLLAVQENE